MGDDETFTCACGTEIPTEGVDWEPQCRHCQRRKSYRLLGKLS